jgi:adenylate cyclase
MLAGAWNELQARGPGTKGFTFGPYLALVAEFPPESGIDWRVLGVVPKLDYFGDAEHQAWLAAAIGALCALIATLFGAMLSSRVSDAMHEISDEMDRIGRFEMSDRRLAEEGSIVREVNAMAEATDRMKASLRSFGKYVPRELVQDLLLSGREARLEGEKIEITTLFSDIAGFTTLSESLAPDELVHELGEYFERMSETIREHSGTVDKYIGDAIMAFWGAPRPLKDHALFACRCALSMRDRLLAMQAEWARQGRPSMSARIGINTGVAVVGNIGSPNRMNYTAMGDAVNLASRLEGLNKSYGTGIAIGETTAALVKDQMVLRPLDWVAVKGKAKAVLVHELLGEKGKVDGPALKAVELHREALELYRARKFDAAELRFLEVFSTLGKSDAASWKMAERCKEYLAEPPPLEWNGAYAMAEK